MPTVFPLSNGLSGECPCNSPETTPVTSGACAPCAAAMRRRPSPPSKDTALGRGTSTRCDGRHAQRQRIRPHFRLRRHRRRCSPAREAVDEPTRRQTQGWAGEILEGEGGGGVWDPKVCTKNGPTRISQWHISVFPAVVTLVWMGAGGWLPSSYGVAPFYYFPGAGSPFVCVSCPQISQSCHGTVQPMCGRRNCSNG